MNTPGDSAGLKPGDIIVSFENSPVTSINELHKLLNEGKINKNCRIGYLRKGIYTESNVTPVELQ